MELRDGSKGSVAQTRPRQVLGSFLTPFTRVVPGKKDLDKRLASIWGGASLVSMGTSFGRYTQLKPELHCVRIMLMTS